MASMGARGHNSADTTRCKEASIDITAAGTGTVYSGETQRNEQNMSPMEIDVLFTLCNINYTYMPNTPNTKQGDVQTAPG